MNRLYRWLRLWTRTITTSRALKYHEPITITSNAQAGDLLILIIGTNTETPPGWATYREGPSGRMVYKIAQGGELPTEDLDFVGFRGVDHLEAPGDLDPRNVSFVAHDDPEDKAVDYLDSLYIGYTIPPQPPSANPPGRGLRGEGENRE